MSVIQTRGFLACVSAILIPVQAFAAEQLANADFANGADGWWASDNLALDVSDGQACVRVPAGTVNAWDAIVGQDNVTLTADESYKFSFSASGAPKGTARALVQMPVDPWDSYVVLTPQLGPEVTTFEGGFVAPVTMDNAQVVFQIGGLPEEWTFCLSAASLDGGAELAKYEAETGPRIRVNQFGYLPDGPKNASLVTEATEPLAWQLRAPSGEFVASGRSTPRGLDPSSGLNVHTISFSAVTGQGEGFVLSVDGERSYPFDILEDIYDPLRRDAMSYFYLARSGIEILGEIAGEEYARPAGHISDAGGTDANKGDIAVPCQDPASSLKAYGEPWTCDYTLDVTGGWYDAGDHGKYVVNGGISVAQLLSAYERLVLRGNEAALADGTLPVPEQDNGIPDLLDEVRWELDFMLKMVVPEGDIFAGLVHHKIHDNEWTGLPLMPHLSDKVRELHRPSTAATLNLAATAAQAARLFRPYDAAYAEELLEAAKASYRAAKTQPRLLATPEDGASGGGPYDDTALDDELYWAAAELYLTTGEDTYLRDLKVSPFWVDEAFRMQGFDWKFVASLARMNLATVPSDLADADVERIRESVLNAADAYLAAQSTQAFGQVYVPQEGLYDWGSNHLHLQNAIVLATAYELSSQSKYRLGALEAMDYIFGRNALNLSYVTGYGRVYAENQHSRWFAAQLNPELPHPPKGSLAGGPNSSIQDPVAQRLLKDCAPQFCYVDDIESWSTNEITINWNASLSQIASWLADQ